MEGTLDTWQGLMGIGGWCKKYFVLSDNVLTICDKKGGDVEAKMHLKVATVDPKETKPTQFNIYSGVSKFKIKAESNEVKSKWLEVL